MCAGNEQIDSRHSAFDGIHSRTAYLSRSCTRARRRHHSFDSGDKSTAKDVKGQVVVVVVVVVVVLDGWVGGDGDGKCCRAHATGLRLRCQQFTRTGN